MYLSLKELKDFVDNKFIIKENVLTYNNKTLLLTDSDIAEMPNIIDYISQTIRF